MKKTNPLRLTIAMTMLSASLILPQVHAANKVWSGAGADAFWNTGGNWGGTAPVNSDILSFTGTTQQNNTNNLSSLIVGAVTFTNGGFTLKGNQLIITNTMLGLFTNLAGTNLLAMDVFIQPAAVTPKVWSIASGSELQMSGAVTNAQPANPLGSLVGGGTLRITSASFQPNRFFTIVNGTIIFDGGFALTQDGFRLQPPSGNTAVFQVTNNATFRLLNGANIRLGQTATGGTSLADVSSGLLDIAVTAGTGSGDLFVGEAASTTAVFNQSGGTVQFSGNGNNRVVFANGNASANGTYNLSGGTLWTKQIVQITAGSPGGTFNFNGGTLKPTASSTTFFQGVQTANVQGGGAIIDTTNFNITIGQNLLAAGGGLTKLGTGTLTLSGTSTYTGSTIVSNGTLAIATTSLTGNGGLVLGDGSTLSVTVASAGSAMTNSALTAGVSSGSAIAFNLVGNPTTAPIYATSLTANAPVTVNVSGSGLTSGTFELIHFDSVTGLGNFQLGTVTLGVSATLVTNANSVSLNISSVVKSLAWNGSTNNQWDTSSIDWNDLGNANNPTNYAQSGGFGDIVIFDDTALSNTTINVSLPVTPVAMTFSNSSLAYSLSGSGEIDGLGNLAKYLTNSLTIATSNNFSGGMKVNAGKIRVGNDNALGSGLLTLSGGTLTSDSTTNRILPNATKITANTTFGDVTDNGQITINNLMDFGNIGLTLTFNSDVVFAGGATNGTLTSKKGKGTLTINGIVNFNGASDVQDGTVIYNGATVTDSDRLIADTAAVNGIARLVITNGASVTVTTTVGNLRSGRTASTGTNYVDLAGLYSLPNVDSIDGYATLRGDTAYSEMTFWPGGDFTARGVTNTGGIGNTVFKFNGGILRARSDSPNFFQGLSQTLVQAGGANIDDGGFTIAINQNFLDAGGSGGLTKTGIGRLLLNGNNTYTGTTLVSQGILGGSGTISGPVNMASGTTLAPGATAAIGTLTINSNLTLSNGCTVSVQVNKDDSSKDLVTGLGDVAYAGTLTVTNIGANPLAGGETFQLFSASGTKSGNFSSIVILPNTGVTNATFDPATGVLTITSPIPTTPTSITFNITGGDINLSWPSNYLGWSLQVQTSDLSAGLGTNWITIPGSESVTATNFPVVTTNGAVFYRMFYQP